jgi:alkanesulfonate monooxygenase SsuD/methylene tetrahydromethanopterin reductase-like flavin-dependent oxidoreductase (luciferase family)
MARVKTQSVRGTVRALGRATMMRRIAEHARRIEAGGFAGIWVGDPLRRALDPLTELAALAAVTATLRDSAAHVADLHDTQSSRRRLKTGERKRCAR